MRRDLERRLVRAEISAAAISWADYRAAQHRSSLRTRGKICDGILEYRAANGMTPELGELTPQRDEVAIELAVQLSHDALNCRPVFCWQSVHFADKMRVHRDSGMNRLDLGRTLRGQFQRRCAAIIRSGWKMCWEPASAVPTMTGAIAA